MDDIKPPSPLNVAAMGSVCRDTVIGWLWYCDEHDTHGNADSRAEAEVMSDAHRDFFDNNTDLCDVLIWRRTPKARLANRPGPRASTNGH